MPTTFLTFPTELVIHIMENESLHDLYNLSNAHLSFFLSSGPYVSTVLARCLGLRYIGLANRLVARTVKCGEQIRDNKLCIPRGYTAYGPTRADTDTTEESSLEGPYQYAQLSGDSWYLMNRISLDFTGKALIGRAKPGWEHISCELDLSPDARYVSMEGPGCTLGGGRVVLACLETFSNFRFSHLRLMEVQFPNENGPPTAHKLESSTLVKLPAAARYVKFVEHFVVSNSSVLDDGVAWQVVNVKTLRCARLIFPRDLWEEKDEGITRISYGMRLHVSLRLVVMWKKSICMDSRSEIVVMHHVAHLPDFLFEGDETSFLDQPDGILTHKDVYVEIFSTDTFIHRDMDPNVELDLTSPPVGATFLEYTLTTRYPSSPKGAWPPTEVLHLNSLYLLPTNELKSYQIRSVDCTGMNTDYLRKAPGAIQYAGSGRLKPGEEFTLSFLNYDNTRLESRTFRCPDIAGVEDFTELTYDESRGIILMEAKMENSIDKGMFRVNYADPETEVEYTKQSNERSMLTENHSAAVHSNRLRKWFQSAKRLGVHG
ncbi:hypothetical protein SISSUDRAFT_1132445 [Sistotremastrum suecicum HHB10207 ss-3]|uniref:Uncharacterized protein n=1 Tax=Sistotremastrum suecicum HHB10207 ss-3 TaxID=1314776 RepID=A0A165YUU8_9AGAM|nr:hypothetical protein SISSUDRAFT_1132445 [Sistotremastrum suecicum HHB10207 ss-3]